MESHKLLIRANINKIVSIVRNCSYILDDWITEVYQPNRSIKAKDVALYHLTDIQRYSVQGWLHLLRVKLLYLPKQIENGICTLKR